MTFEQSSSVINKKKVHLPKDSPYTVYVPSLLCKFIKVGKTNYFLFAFKVGIFNIFKNIGIARLKKSPF